MEPNFHYVQKEKLQNLPKTPGVYLLCAQKEVLYIGKATNLQSRVKSHFQQPTHRDALFIEKVTRVGYQETSGEIDALLLESQLIKHQQPRYNVMWRDDKSYFYVAITKEDLPRVFIAHKPTERKTNHGPTHIQNTAYNIVNTHYIGPFTEGRQLKKVLRLLRRVFPYYISKTHPKTPCQYCNLGLCPGPTPDKKAYQKSIKRLSEVLEGKKSSVLLTLEKEMNKAAKEQRFELAGDLRDQLVALKNIFEHASLFSPSDFSHTRNYATAQKELQSLFAYPRPIQRIEAYDISNIQGEQATGSMPVFLNGTPAKQHYRKFKIRIGNTPNDFAMMREVINRRLSHSEWEYPDLIVIDGGKGQLSAALQARAEFAEKASAKLREKAHAIAIGALAKKQNELFLPGNKQSTLLSTLAPETRNLLMHIRDEAHRFAITYHRKLRSVDIRGNH